MSMRIENHTRRKLNISLNQVGPVYYKVVPPFDTFYRKTGAVHWTVVAYPWEPGNEITGCKSFGKHMEVLGLVTVSLGVVVLDAFAAAKSCDAGDIIQAIVGAGAMMMGIRETIRGEYDLYSTGWYASYNHHLKIVERSSKLVLQYTDGRGASS